MSDPPTKEAGSSRLSLLLAAAMFVLVVDTSLMNVSISAVVEDLDTTVSSVQSAIALEALVSAAFILISSKIGDLFGRKRAYTLGLLGYAVGAVAMTLAQSLTAIIIFWAIIGGLGASLLLPAMQSLIHGNFEGAAQKKTYALVGAAAAIAAAVGPLLGGFVTTYLSWRVGFLLEAVVIAVVLSQLGLLKDVPYTGERQVDGVGAGLSVIGMGGVVLGILVWQEGGDYVALLIAIGALALWALARWLVRRHREGKVTLLDPELFELPHFKLGFTAQMLQNITLGGAMIALPIFLQIKLEYDALETGLSLAPLSLTMFAVAILAGRRSGDRRGSEIIRAGFALSTLGLALIIPIVPARRLRLVPVHPAGDRGRGARPARVAAQQLHARPDRRRPDQRGGRRELGVGVVRPVVRPGRGRRHPARHPLPGLHQHDEREPRDPLVAAGADRADARGRRPGREQHGPRGAARRRAAGRPGGDPRDQHRRDEPRPSGRDARTDPRGPPRALQLVPHDAATGHQALGVRRGSLPRLESSSRSSLRRRYGARTAGFEPAPMLTTTRIKRGAALALALAAVVAPGASARVADAQRGHTPWTAPRGAEPAAAAPTRADMVARREALATKAWLAANPPKIIEVSQEDGGFDLLSAGIGAAVPLTLILFEVAGRQVLRRRRDSEVASHSSPV